MQQRLDVLDHLFRDLYWAIVVRSGRHPLWQVFVMTSYLRRAIIILLTICPGFHFTRCIATTFPSSSNFVFMLHTLLLQLTKMVLELRIEYMTVHYRISSTYGHSQLKTGHPVRSAIHKQLNGRLVLRWVTTWESLLLYVLHSIHFLRSHVRIDRCFVAYVRRNSCYVL
jgi:hypothetical protein